MAEDGVHEVVYGIAAEGEERGVGRVLALGGVEGLGFKNFFYFFYLSFLLLIPQNFPARSVTTQKTIFSNFSNVKSSKDYKTLEFKASNETLKATDSRLFLKWKKPRHCITESNILKYRNSNESLELNRKSLGFGNFSKMEN